MAEETNKVRKKNHFLRNVCILLIAFLLADHFLGWGVAYYIRDTISEYRISEISDSQPPEAVETVSTEKYAYSTLDDETKQVYDQVLDAILSYEEDYAVSTTDKGVLDKAYSCVMADYGNLFWQNGYSYEIYSVEDDVRRILFTPTYIMTRDEKEAYEAQIENAIPEFLEGTDAAASDYDKAKSVFERLITMVDYDTASENNQNIISTFIGRSTVCQGYACAVNVLFDRLGLQACIVTGNATSEPHALNLVRLDGEYYYMDVTWGNGSYYTNDDALNATINYAYLNFTSEDLSRYFTPAETYSLPECKATADNYYHREGLYFDSFDTIGIGSALARGYTGENRIATIRLADHELMDQVREYFITNHHISDTCYGLRSYSYLVDDNWNIITVIF